MTLIASFQSGSTYILVGDLLISSDRKREMPLDIPTRFSKNQPKANLQFSGLSQKLVIINDNLAVGWSGTRINAKSIIHHVKDNIQSPYSGEQILELVASSGLSEGELKSIGLIFYAHNAEAMQLICQDYLVGETVFPNGNKIKYSGSGVFHFFDSTAFEMFAVEGDQNDFMKTAYAILGRMSVVFYEEIITDTNHNYYYGGGFELLSFNPNESRFVKLPISFVFWTYDDEAITLQGPLITQNYTEDNRLVIFRHEFVKKAEWKARAYVVDNFINDDKDKKIDIQKPNFDTMFCMHFFISQRDDAPVKIMGKSGFDKGFSIAPVDGDKYEIIISKKFIEETKSFCWDPIRG